MTWLLRRRYRSRHVRVLESSWLLYYYYQYLSRALHIPASVSESISSVPASTLDSNSECETSNVSTLLDKLVLRLLRTWVHLPFSRKSYCLYLAKVADIFHSTSFIEWPWMDNSSNLPFCFRRTFFSICWAYIFDLRQIIYLRIMLRIIGENVRNTGIE